MHAPHILANALSNDGNLSALLSKLFPSLSRLYRFLTNTQHSALSTDIGLGDGGPGTTMHTFARRDVEKGSTEYIVFACLIPVLVILSGLFAGLTLGYMSLDETQLNVLSVSGTPKQREYANKIKPIRKNGHLLLVTLLLANMITNETLPVISDPIFGGGVEAVVVSTALIVLFSEIIPQSICTRHGLLIGAKCAGVVRILIYAFGIISWPVAKLLEFLLGPHHGIIYRRAELKELVAMHGSNAPLGGDLRTDTVTIIGATLDLQDKTVREAMTPIDKVFMLHIDAHLDYDTLRKICATGHSRIPVYEEVDVEMPTGAGMGEQPVMGGTRGRMAKHKMKKIIGILLVKQCVLLDPEDAVPVRKMRLIKVPYVPQNEPLLGILDRFQEGRSHMAIVSRLSVERAHSVKEEVKRGLTHRLLGALHGDSSSSESSDNESETDSDSESEEDVRRVKSNRASNAGDSTTVGDDKSSSSKDKEKEKESSPKVRFGATFKNRRTKKRKRLSHKDKDGAQKEKDLEKGSPKTEKGRQSDPSQTATTKKLGPGSQLLNTSLNGLEQSMPADAVLSRSAANAFLSSAGPAHAPAKEGENNLLGFGALIDPSIMPLGIITLEDVLEELIGEEIYDEFDTEGAGAHSESFVPPGAHPSQTVLHLSQQREGGVMGIGGRNVLQRKNSAPELSPVSSVDAATATMVTATAAKSVYGASGSGVASGRPALAIPTLPMLKNLGFLRSRSAPPTPREPNSAGKKHSGPGTGGSGTNAGKEANANGHLVSVSGTLDSSGAVTPTASAGPQTGPNDIGGVYPPASTTVNIPTLITTTTPEGQLSPLVEQDSPPADDADAHQAESKRLGHASDSHAQVPPLSIPAPTPAAAFQAPSLLGLGTKIRTAPNSRSASPAPSLEAILHSTKRRSGLSRVASTSSPSPAAHTLMPNASELSSPSAGSVPSSTPAGGSTSSGNGGGSANLDSGVVGAGAGIGTSTSRQSASERGRTRIAKVPKGAFKGSPLAMGSVEAASDANMVIADEIRREKRERVEREAKEAQEKEKEANE